MWPNPQFPADFVTFTKEIPNGKPHFLCSVFLDFTIFIFIFNKFSGTQQAVKVL